MKIEFKDGKEIEFKQFGKIWLAESAMWEETKLECSFDKLKELKAKVSKWFAKNAPTEILAKYGARLPMAEEIIRLPFKDQVAYAEGTDNRIADYLLGDEDFPCPVYCDVGNPITNYGRIYCDFVKEWTNGYAVRLCLEERE